MSPFLCHEELFSLCWSCFLSPACLILLWLSELQLWLLSSVFKNFILLKLLLINERSQAVMQFSHADRPMCSQTFCHTLLWCSFLNIFIFYITLRGVLASQQSCGHCRRSRGEIMKLVFLPLFFSFFFFPIFLELQTAAGHELIPSAAWMIIGGNKHVWGWAVCAWCVCLS